MSIVFTVTAGADITLTPSNGGTVQFTIEPIAHSIPAGGTDGQVLAKASDTDYDVEWVSGGGGGGGANLGYTASATNGIVTSDTGTDATIPLADGTNAGLMTPANFTKLAGIEAGADVTDATNVNAAGAVMESDTSTASMQFVIDEDSFASDSATKVPTQQSTKAYADAREVAAKAYADTLVVGLVDDRGNFDASVNTFPASGGSGTAGAILKGDLWTVSVAGTLGGNAVTAGDLVRALVDTPGQTSSNWAVTENNIGYVAENQNNKDTDSTFAANSDTKYPSQKAVKTALDAKASSTFIDAMSYFIETVADKTYKIVVKIPFAGTINSITTICASGTCTLTGEVNNTALGGTANSVSSSESEQTHSSANTFAVGDDIQITISSNSSCVDMSFTIKFTRTI